MNSLSKSYPYDEIIEKYPNLYKYVKYIECGPGWFNLINECSNKLEKLIIKLKKKEKEDEYFEPPSQVKEKFGSLRFYMSSGTEEMSKIIDKTERASQHICEKCGDKGKINANGMLSCLCDNCRELK